MLRCLILAVLLLAGAFAITVPALAGPAQSYLFG